MSVAEGGPASPEPIDAILLKVLEKVPFQLTTDGGAQAARQRFNALPRVETNPEIRAEDLAVDGARYAELLTAAGVRVELHNAETLIHGHLGAGVVPAATETTERGLSALRRALHA